jgi:MoxR-like ATPase
LQRVIAASAVICKRDEAILSDLWVLRHIWDTEEQREIITNMVNAAIASGLSDHAAHPRAAEHSTPDAEELFKEVEQLSAQWNDPDVKIAERALIKDRLAHLNGRCQWISNDEQRKYVQTPIDQLWNEIMHTA